MAENTSERQYKTLKPGQRRVLQGTVVPNKMSKTITVQIARTERHLKYKKYIRRHSKVYAHDPAEIANPGDMVKIIECRPMSKLKRFTLLEVVRKAGGTS
jgi:small subunit ribosomal protein S17